MVNETENKPKRKRGRPPKKKAELPEFKSENEIREYILNTSLELSLEATEMAKKKNNIKKPSVANAKTKQYDTAIKSLKVANEILDKIQISKLEEKVQLMEEGLIASAMATDKDKEEPSTETLEKIDKLTALTEQLAQLKES